MAKSVYLLVRKQGTIASQNRHLGRSVYSQLLPLKFGENVKYAVRQLPLEVYKPIVMGVNSSAVNSIPSPLIDSISISITDVYKKTSISAIQSMAINDLPSPLVDSLLVNLTDVYKSTKLDQIPTKAVNTLPLPLMGIIAVNVKSTTVFTKYTYEHFEYKSIKGAPIYVAG